MDRLDAMSLLVAAVEAGNLSAAGRKLGVPLPTISRKVADLEAHLKTRLLVRSTRKLALTEAGIAYVAACRRILEDIEEAEARASGEYSKPRGELTLTAPIVFGRLHVLPVVSAFLARFAEITVRLVLADQTMNLADDHIDLAVRIGELPDSRLMATQVGVIRRVVCGSPGYFAAHGTPGTPQDLTAHACVTFSPMAQAISWSFRPRGRPPFQIRPGSRLHVNTAEAAIDAAVAGVGITSVLSYQVARAVAEGRLQIILADFELPAMPVHLVHAHQGLLPLKLRRFLEFAGAELRASLKASQ